MAINYLNTVNFNKNQLEQAAIQNLTANPASGVLGQVYYNTVNSELKICTTAGSPTGAVWTAVGLDNVTYDLASAANVTAGVNINLTGSDSSTDTVNIIGTANEVAIAQTATANKLQIGLPADVTISNDLTVSNDATIDGELYVENAATFNGNVTADADVFINASIELANAGVNVDMGANRVENVANPTSAQDAATKAYVDAATVGGLVYQGGYNAATNTPDLDSSPSSSIKKGWTYTVTADGLFFTEQVRVGDVLIAESDAPTALANWTTVQNNIDLASASQVGIGNVNVNTAGDKDGLSLSYASGTATVGLDINNLPHLNSLTSLDYASIYLPIHNADTSNANEYLELEQILDLVTSRSTYAVTITDTATITHGLGSKNVIIQLYDVTTNETVYADVVRTSTSQATITFSSTPTNSIKVLVQKIG